MFKTFARAIPACYTAVMFENKVKIYLLPFVYVYVLSLGLIFLSVYLLVKAPNGTAQSYAQSENFAKEISIDIKLSEKKPQEDTDMVGIDEDEIGDETEIDIEKQNIISCNDEIAYQIDTFFKNKNAPLSGEGCNFHLHAMENDVNPYIVAAIGFCESTGGKVTPQFAGQESFNAWGWAVYDSNDTTKNINGYSCDSWEHCIGRVTRGIKRNSDRRDLSTEPVDVVKWYNPGSVDRADGIPENSTWTKCVESTINKIRSIPT